MIYSLLVIDVMEAIEQALRGLFGRLCIWVYQLIGMFYNLFITISKVNVLSGNELIETLYNRVGLILGLFMVFKLMFSLIQSLVDPDKLTDKNNGAVSIIKRSLIAIVLLGITPSLFKEAYDLQATLVGAKSSSDNILYKLIFAKDTAAYVDNFGNELAAEFYFSFFKDDEYPELTDEIENEDRFTSYTGDTIETLKKKVLSADKFSLDDTYQYLMMTSTGGQYVIEFSPLLCLGAGILILWIIITYCVQIAVRVFQLAYLQLIAPIPILSYISKPDGSFKKWTTQCTTTYLDLFLRLAIIYFVMAMVHSLSKVFENIDNSFFVELFLIIGLLQFAKKAPDLIKEIFPSMGGAAKFDFGLGSKPLKGLATFGAGAAIGAVGGAISGVRNGYGGRGKVAGFFGGIGRGALGGAKTKGSIIKNVQGGMSNTRQARQRALDRQMAKIDNNKMMQNYQKNEAIMAAKKAIDDRAESQLLKKDTAAQAAYARLNYIESNVGKKDVVTGKTITTADVATQKAIYNSHMDTLKSAWINSNAATDAEVAKQMQIIQNKTGKSINTYADIDAASTLAKTENTTNVRGITENEATKQKMQDKKNKIK